MAAISYYVSQIQGYNFVNQDNRRNKKKYYKPLEAWVDHIDIFWSLLSGIIQFSTPTILSIKITRETNK